MAETTGNDPKTTTGKAAKPETKSAAVKPPVLDLKPRETAGKASPTKPESKPEPKPQPTAKAAASEPPKPSEPARPAARPGETTSTFPIAATIAGGVLGLAAAYGLAWAGLWPASPAPTPPADPRIAQLVSSVPELETVTQTTQSELATLNQRVSDLESSEPATVGTENPATVDFGPIESELAALTQRIDALAGSAQGAAELEGLQTELAALGSRFDELAARLGTAEAGLRSLDTTVSETTASLADQPSDIGAVLQLPLILSGFETAFATGRPYETELAALRAALPDVQIPTPIANSAASGLTRPDIIATRFADALPAMLAGRPADPTAQWQDGALDWFRSAVALRPTGEIEGDTPEALMSQLEAAVERRDFAAADTLVERLPQPMQMAAGTVSEDIARQAEAARFLETLRSSALSGEAAQ